MQYYKLHLLLSESCAVVFSSKITKHYFRYGDRLHYVRGKLDHKSLCREKLWMVLNNGSFLHIKENRKGVKAN
jgi:hypothetical protein